MGVKEDERGGKPGGPSVEVELRGLDEELDLLVSSSSSSKGAGWKVRVGVRCSLFAAYGKASGSVLDRPRAARLAGVEGSRSSKELEKGSS